MNELQIFNSEKLDVFGLWSGAVNHGSVWQMCVSRLTFGFLIAGRD